MKQYAKLIDKQLHFCAPRHISNPTPEVIEIYALANQYKQYIKKDPPHQYCTHSYKETTKQITDVWTEIPLADAQAQQKAIIIASCNAAYNEAMAIYSQAEIAVAQQAESDVIAIMATAREISVDQQSTELHQALAMGKVVNAALAGYSLRLEDKIKAALSHADIAAILWDREEFTGLVESLMNQNEDVNT